MVSRIRGRFPRPDAAFAAVLALLSLGGATANAAPRSALPIRSSARSVPEFREPPLADSAYAFVGVSVIPMTEDRVLADQTVLVREGRIVEVGPSRRVAAPAPASNDGVAPALRGGWPLPYGRTQTVAVADTPATSASPVNSGAAVGGYDAFRGLKPAEIEAFLRTAHIVAVREIGKGVTKPWRATLDDGRLRHTAGVQIVDVCEQAAPADGAAPASVSDGGDAEATCDSYKFNVAAYEIGKLLGLTWIPPSVERPFNGRNAAFTWWIDDAATLAELEVRGAWTPGTGHWAEQKSTVGVFDELIANSDRHQANLIQDPAWWVWMIDHTRAFALAPRLHDPERVAELGMDPALLDRLRALNAAALRRCCETYLTSPQRASLLARRDSILAVFH